MTILLQQKFYDCLHHFQIHGAVCRNVPTPLDLRQKNLKAFPTPIVFFFSLSKRKECEVPSPSVKNKLERAGIGGSYWITIPGNSQLFFFLYLPDKRVCLNNAYINVLPIWNHNLTCIFILSLFKTNTALLRSFQTISFCISLLKDCGGFQLLRSRGSTRYKKIETIPCPDEGYAPEYLLSESVMVGQALIYIRPLQKDTDLQVGRTRLKSPVSDNTLDVEKF